MFNFRKLFEFFIKDSFNISRDVHKLIELRDHWFVRYVVFFKRSWYYGLFRIHLPILSLILLFLNIQLLYKNLPWIIGIIAIIVVTISVLLSVYTYINYIFKYKKIYNKQYSVENINKTIKKVEIWDAAFTKFFNQWWFNQILFIILIIILITYMIFIDKFHNWVYSILNIIVFIGQFILIRQSVSTLQNLEMDFWIGTRELDDADWKIKWVFIYVDQKWFKLERDKNFFSEQIKTIDIKIPLFIWMLLNFWKVIIDIEWGEDSSVSIPTLKNPVKLKDSLNKIIKGSIRWYERNLNYYLDYILINENIRPKQVVIVNKYEQVIWIKDEYKEQLRKLVQLKEYDEFLKHQYKNNDLDEYVKWHIENIYKRIK